MGRPKGTRIKHERVYEVGGSKGGRVGARNGAGS